MTRKQKKRDKLVTLYYHSGVLSARRKPKVRYSQLFSNFLQALKNALTINAK